MRFNKFNRGGWGVPALLLAALSMMAEHSHALMTWDARADFLGSPNQSNSLTDVWQYFQITDNLRDGSYPLLPSFSTSTYGLAGLHGWNVANGTPAVVKNMTGATILVGSANAQYGAGKLVIHPGTSSMVVIGWESPITGMVDVMGSLTDVDTGGGDGINWFLDKGGSSGNLDLGSLINGGSDSFSLSDVPVNAGNYLYLIVHNKAGFSFDSTRVEFTITQTIPEPSALGLLVLSGFILVRRR